MELMKAWVHDLKSIGYKFPALKEQSLTAPLTIIPSDKAITATAPAWERYNDMVLVINFDDVFSKVIDIVGVLQKAYQPLFRQVVFTGSEQPQGLPESTKWVNCHSAKETLRYSCLANAIEEVPVPPTGGYLFLSNDALFSHCQLASFNKSRIWFHTNVTIVHGKAGTADERPGRRGQHFKLTVRPGNVEVSSGQALTEVLSSLLPSGKHTTRLGEDVARLLEHPDQKHVGEEWADGFYIPQRLASQFVTGAFILHEAEIHHEIAVPTLLALLDKNPIELFRATYVGDTDDKKPESFLLPTGQLQNSTFLFHPFDMFRSGAVEHFQQWWYDSSFSKECPRVSGSVAISMGTKEMPNVYIKRL